MESLLKNIGDSQLKDIIDSIEFGDARSFKEIQDRFPDYDSMFLWLLSYTKGGAIERREYIEKNYLKYRKILDKQFPKEFPQKGKFTSRMWEMVLCDVFSSSGTLLDRTKGGPDFQLLDSSGELIYIEAVAPDESEDLTVRAIRPTYDKANTFEISGSIDDLEYPILSRVFNKGFIEKAERKNYTKGKPLIIAINSSKVVGLISQDEYVLRRMLFGLGCVTLTYMPDGSIRKGLQASMSLKRKGKIDLDLGVFRDKRFAHVSGIVYSSKSPLSLIPGNDGWSRSSVIFVPNPLALYPVKAVFPFLKTIICSEEKYEEIDAEQDFISSVVSC